MTIRSQVSQFFSDLWDGAPIQERKRPEHELRTRIDQQAALAYLSQRALGGMELPVLFDDSVALLSRTLRVEYSEIMELLPDGQAFLLKAGAGWKDDCVGHTTVDGRKDSQSAYTLNSNKPVIVDDFSHEIRFGIPSLFTDHGITSGISVVILGSEKPFGILSAHSKERRKFTQEDIHFLQGIANLLAMAISRKKAEERMAYQAHLLANVNDAILASDSRGSITAWNRAAEKLYGWKAEEVLDRKVQEVIRFDFDEAQRAAARKNLAGSGSFYTEMIQYTRDGAAIYVEGTTTTLRDEKGQVTGYVTVNRDVTARKRAEALLMERNSALQESEERFRQLSENIQEVFWMTNASGEEVIYVNPAYEKVWGRNLENLRADNASWQENIHPQDRERVAAAWTPEKLARSEYDVEYRILRADGSVRWIRDRGFPIRNEQGEVYRIVGIAEDITNQVQAEEVLWQHAERLGILREIDRAILSAKSLEKIAQVALQHLSRIIPDLKASVAIFDKDHSSQTARSIYSNPAQELFSLPEIPLHAFGIMEDLRAGRVFLVEDASSFSDRAVLAEGVCSYASIPLVAQNELIGTLCLGSADQGAFPPRTLEIGREVADSIAIAIQQAQLLQQLREANKQLRKLSQEIVSTQEKERRRVSRELHDEAGQTLTALKISLELLQAELKTMISESLQQSIAEAKSLTERTMDQIHLLAHALRPPELDAVGLNPVLDELCRQVSRRFQLPIYYQGTEIQALPDMILISIYRVLQEALTNIIKHANARQVKVDLHCDDQILRLTVEDDGRGFEDQPSHDESDRGPGIGLLGIQERLDLLGGILQIESRKDQGTRLVAEIPWRNEE